MPSRRLGAWIKTWNDSVSVSSEAEYNANADIIDEVLPLNGGVIQADATITQNPERTDNPFAQGLRAQTTANGQRYTAALHSQNLAATMAILDAPGLYQTLADNIVSLAQTRFDAPWDAVNLELGYPPVGYEAAWADLVYLLCYEIRKAGILLSFYFASGADYYAYDPELMAQVADWIEFSTYSGLPAQKYAAIHQNLEDYLSTGFDLSQFAATLGNYSQVWLADGSDYNTGYSNAVDLINGAGEAVHWIESWQNDLWRLRCAAMPDGDRVYVPDADSLRCRLELLDRLGIYRASLFLPGQGDPREWDVLADWKAGNL